MNRFLLSLWLLGAALFGANMLIILGWPSNEPKIDAGSVKKEVIEPKDGSEPQKDHSVNAGLNDAPAVRLEPKGPTSLPPPGQSPQNATGADHDVTAMPPLPSAPQHQQERVHAVPLPPESQAPSSQALAENQLQAAPQAQNASPDQSGEANGAMAAQQAGEWVKVASSGANVRSGPSSSASRITSLSPGQDLRVVSREKGWVQVAAPNGSTGWIYEKLLDPSAAPETPPAPEQDGTQTAASDTGAANDQGQRTSERVRVARPGAKVVSGPSDEATMLFGFPEGRELRVLSRQPGWVQIMDPESQQAGWITESSLAPVAAEKKNEKQKEAAAPQRRNRTASHPPSKPEKAELDDEWLAAEEEEFGPPSDIIERPRRARKWGRRGGRFAGGLRRTFRGAF